MAVAHLNALRRNKFWQCTVDIKWWQIKNWVSNVSEWEDDTQVWWVHKHSKRLMHGQRLSRELLSVCIFYVRQEEVNILLGVFIL